jgi:NAD(P)-dependent dehydrogenase (short-subunit alcohol dehydrogenase family)
VTLAVRETAAGERAAADIVAATGNHGIHVGRLELADLASVAAFGAAWRGPLHLLINNAGVMALPDLQLTREGWELQFATSLLVATSPQLEGIGGRYFEDCNEAVVFDADAPETSASGVAAYALDRDAAIRLWEISSDAVAPGGSSQPLA